MKKIIKLIIFFLLLGFSSVYSFTTNLTINLELKDSSTKEVIQNQVIRIISEDGVNQINRIFISDEKGTISIPYFYNDEKENEIKVSINNNIVNLTGFDSTITTINVLYDREEGSISQFQTSNGKVQILNQEINVNTNYKLLVFFGFITLLVVTIGFGGRFFYTSLDKDIKYHHHIKK